MSERTNLMLTGGWAHDFATTAPVLAETIDAAGVTTEIVDDPDRFGERLTAGAVDMVTVYACWFRMLDARYTEQNRADWARATSPELRQALTDHVDGGGGLFAVHTATVCFDDWPGWADLVGGGWNWDRSFHPPPEPLEMRIAVDHRVTDAVGGAQILDERYTDLEIAPTSTVLSVTVDDDGEQPAAWAHEERAGRVVYDSFGHSVESLTNPAHERLIHNAVAWILEGTDA